MRVLDGRPLDAIAAELKDCEKSVTAWRKNSLNGLMPTSRSR